jgi:hypothetical protein
MDSVPFLTQVNMLSLMETNMNESSRVIQLAGFINGDWEAKEVQGKFFYRPSGSKDKWQEGHPPSISPELIRDAIRRFDTSAKEN